MTQVLPRVLYVYVYKILRKFMLMYDYLKAKPKVLRDFAFATIFYF